MANYVLEGPHWGSGAGAVVTWAVDTSVPTSFVSEIARAFADWTSHAGITFLQAASVSAANISFSETAIDGLDNTLAQTSYSYQGASFTSARITFDSGEGWHAAAGGIVSNDSIALFPVALHEIGHAIGLDHYNDAPAIMNAYLNRSVTDLTGSDIGGIQALYGAGSPGVSQTAGTHDVFRFYNAATHDHFYTTDVAERDSILRNLPSYSYEGAQWSTPDAGAHTLDVFRFFNPTTGDHVYTTDLVERDAIIRNLPSYRYEGIAFEAYATPADAGSGGVTLERFYNAALGVHHFAVGQAEADGIRHGAVGSGWVDEGPGLTVHLPNAATLLA